MRYRDQVLVPVVVGLFIASACGGPESPCDCGFFDYLEVAAGFNVATHKNPADTAVRASYSISGWGDTAGWKYTASSISPAPHGTITSVRLLQGTVVKGTLCTGAGCSAAVPLATKITGVTDVTLRTSMRNVAVRVAVLTDSDPAGVADGAIYPATP